MYSGQQTCVIETKPAVKMQSASASPGIAMTPRSVLQVPMPDDGSTDSGGVAVTVSMLPTDEEVNEGEENESGDGDDEEEVDEINHAKLPSVVIHVHSPGRRPYTSAVWTHLRRIDKHDVPGHEMNADCTHVCVLPPRILVSGHEMNADCTHVDFSLKKKVGVKIKKKAKAEGKKCHAKTMRSQKKPI